MVISESKMDFGLLDQRTPKYKKFFLLQLRDLPSIQSMPAHQHQTGISVIKGFRQENTNQSQVKKTKMVTKYQEHQQNQNRNLQSLLNPPSKHTNQNQNHQSQLNPKAKLKEETNARAAANSPWVSISESTTTTTLTTTSECPVEARSPVT